MQNQQQTTPLEWAGMGLGLLLYVVAVAELTGVISVLPVPAYIVALVLLTVLLWAYRRQYRPIP